MAVLTQPRVPPAEVIYPESDGKPLAETDIHQNQIIYLREALKEHFREQPQVYVSSDIFVYYVEGDTRQSVAPDILVVKGVEKKNRRYYQTWVEGKAPDVVIEITSPSTRYIDDKEKPLLYRRLGVLEYFQYDPKGKYLKPALRGRRLHSQGHYESMSMVQGLDGSVILTSTVLGLQLRLESGKLRLFDPHTMEYLETYSESVHSRRQAELQAQLALQHTELALQHAESERQRAELALQQAESERQWAAQLAAQLRALGIDPERFRQSE